MFNWWRRLTRAQVLAETFPDEFRQLLLRRVPLVRQLPDADRAKLEALVRVFLSEKSLEGAGGLELDDEMRIVIAARACLLVLHRVELDDPLYPELSSVVVYPSSYRVRETQQDGYVVIEGEETRLGESWTRGVVVLSWDAVVTGGANREDGHDVVLHEFAHQLDAEDGLMDGTPELDDRRRYAAWSRIAGAEFTALQEAVERHKKTTLDAYGASNEPEFFAVAVEAFFEKPLRLRHDHPELYAELVVFFRLDPAELLSGGDPGFGH
jgi:Mlc titration factor MtfA (ptsG expression regulator)